MVLKVFYVGRKRRTNAFGEYDTDSGKLTVFKGSIISESIATFSGTNKFMKLREQYANQEGMLCHDVIFNSPSTAAKFVSGYSANGLTAWHVEKNKTLKKKLQEIQKSSL